MNDVLVVCKTLCTTRMTFGYLAIVVVLVAISLLTLVSPLQISYADDFVADAQCVEGHWYVTIYDEQLYGDDAGSGQLVLDAPNDSGLLSGVSIRTIISLGSSDVKSSFETDNSGSFFLAPEYNTGWVWLSKPGYNDQKIKSSCDTAYDAFSYSEQFASYCYDYTFAAIPATYLPVMIDGQISDGSVKSIVDFFDEQITLRDNMIRAQSQEIKALLDVLVYDNATGYDVVVDAANDTNTPGAITTLSNNTKDTLCLLHIQDATSMVYEMLGALHVLRSGILEVGGSQDAWDMWLEDLTKRTLSLKDTPYCSDGVVGSTPKMTEKLRAGLETLHTLHAELERQIKERQYLSSLTASSQQVSSYQQQPTYYNSDYYYTGNNRYDRSNDVVNFYNYDNSKLGDQNSRDTSRNYNLEDHEDHDHGHSNCITFCDKDDYEPDWARYLDKYGALEACWDVDANPDRIGTADWYWCKDLAKYLSRR